MNPTVVEVAVMGGTPEHAVERLKSAIDAENMPAEVDFKIASCELIEENVAVDENEIEELYATTDKRVLN